MSHPMDRRHRFIIGKNKGEKRAQGLFSGDRWITNDEIIGRHARRLRDTTKPCACSMCQNPRHSGWYKGGGNLTMQERKFFEKDRLENIGS